jgi:hypothetical protein
MILTLAIWIFVVLESLNVIIMYGKPEFKYGNSMAVFQGWADLKTQEPDHLFAKYLVYWVANCKVIFILLLATIALIGDNSIKVIGVVVTMCSIGLYFVTLHPIITQLDRIGKINPPGYSQTLGVIVGSFMVMFTGALVLHFLIQ